MLCTNFKKMKTSDRFFLQNGKNTHKYLNANPLCYILQTVFLARFILAEVSMCD